MKIEPKYFALAVASGNPSPGKTPDEISNNAIQLYLSALEEAETFNKENKDATASLKNRPPWL